MNDAKYIGLDVHQATISVAVRDSAGKLVIEAILETKAETILQFLRGLRGSLHVTFEEGTWAAWLHDLLQPHVTRVLVCDPRKNALVFSCSRLARHPPTVHFCGFVTTRSRGFMVVILGTQVMPGQKGCSRQEPRPQILTTGFLTSRLIAHRTHVSISRHPFPVRIARD